MSPSPCDLPCPPIPGWVWSSNTDGSYVLATPFLGVTGRIDPSPDGPSASVTGLAHLTTAATHPTVAGAAWAVVTALALQPGVPDTALRYVEGFATKAWRVVPTPLAPCPTYLTLYLGDAPVGTIFDCGVYHPPNLPDVVRDAHRDYTVDLTASARSRPRRGTMPPAILLRGAYHDVAILLYPDAEARFRVDGAEFSTLAAARYAAAVEALPEATPLDALPDAGGGAVQAPVRYAPYGGPTSAYGWDPRKDRFCVPLGTYPSPEAALSALNAHPPTRARWGRIVPKRDGPRVLRYAPKAWGGMYLLEEAPEGSVLDVYGPSDVEAYGWDRYPQAFSRSLGTFTSAQEALAALNSDHATAARWGVLALPRSTALHRQSCGSYAPYGGSAGPPAILRRHADGAYRALGWSAAFDCFYEDLGISPTLAEALAALNAHAPTVEEFGRLVLAAP